MCTFDSSKDIQLEEEKEKDSGRGTLEVEDKVNQSLWTRQNHGEPYLSFNKGPLALNINNEKEVANNNTKRNGLKIGGLSISPKTGQIVLNRNEEANRPTELTKMDADPWENKGGI